MGAMSPRISRRHALAAAATGATGLALAPVAAIAQPARGVRPAVGRPGQEIDVRVATYNTALNRPAAGDLVRALSTGEDPQARAVAQVVQINNPDIVLLNEVDHDEAGEALDLLRRNYLEVSQGGCTPVHYPYAYTAPVNTGEPSGLDLDGDGAADGPGDAYGFGAFPGQYGMAILSRYPILAEEIRTFRLLPWSAVPSNLIPESFYSPQAVAALRLSSKSHWDVPVRVNGQRLHLLASHPTPPSFDGPERRNARRNHDEIRLWADYLSGGHHAAWIVDDAGVAGGLRGGESAVVLGDLNADPEDGDGWPGAIEQLLAHRRLQDTLPVGSAAGEKTGDFTPPPDGPGRLRVDYVLPTRDLTVVGSGVFWPRPEEPGGHLMGTDASGAPISSDHRLVRLDLRIGA